MRITKVKVNVKQDSRSYNSKMVLMHRNIKKGQLILDTLPNTPNGPIDFTDSIIDKAKDRSFELSLLKKTIVDKNDIRIPYCEKCQTKANLSKGKKEPCDHCKKRTEKAENLSGKIKDIIKPIIEQALYNHSSRTNSSITATQEEITELKYCLKKKFIDTIKYKDCNGNSRELCLLGDLRDYFNTQDPQFLRPYKDWVKHYIKTKKEFTKKSIINNNLVVDYSQSSTLSKRKSVLKNWSDQYKEMGTIDLSKQENDFGMDQLIESLPKPIEETNFKFNLEVKKALQARQKAVFGTENENYAANRNNNELATYYNEVVKYFEHYFPIKKKNEKKKMTVEQAERYLKEKTIKETVKHQIENSIRLQLLQEGKAVVHEFKSQTNSITLSGIKRDEFFVLNLIESCAFATNNIRNIVDPQQEKDILGKGDLKTSLKEILSDNKVFQNETYSYFFGEELSIDSEIDREKLNQTIWALRGSVQGIRNKIIHYKTDSINSIFNIEKFEHMTDVFAGQETTTNEKYESSIFKTYLERDLNQVKNVFIEQLRSNDILNYYRYKDIKHLLSKLEFSLCKCSIPFAPGFKTTYKYGSNLQEGNKPFELEHYLLKEKNLKKTTASKAYPAYRFLLKLIYDYCFLNHFLNNNNKKDFIDVVKFTLENNKPKDSGNHQYAFNGIPKMRDNQDIDAYLSQIHSLAVQEDTKKKEKEGEQFSNTQKFIQQVFVKGFDNFLEKTRVDFLLLPNQDQSKEETSPNYETLVEHIKVNHHISANSDTHIAFYTFCKLLDAQHLSDLRNEFIKYNASQRDKKDKEKYNHIIDILGLCLLYADQINNQIENKNKDNWMNDLKSFIEEDGNKFINKDLYIQSDNDTPVVHASIALIRKYGTINILKNIIADEGKVTLNDYNDWKAFKVKTDDGKSTVIEDLMTKRMKLHEEWVELVQKTKEKKSTKNDLSSFVKSHKDEYQLACNEIERYNWLDNKIHLVHIKQLHNLMIQLLSRLARFVALWDRNAVIYFMPVIKKEFDFNKLKKLIAKRANNNNNELKDNELRRMLKNKSNDKEECGKESLASQVNELRSQIDSFIKVFNIPAENPFNGRDFIAHYNYITLLEKNEFLISESSIIDLINHLRTLMQHDRKLRNAVTKSIIKVFDQNGMSICFEFIDDKNHNLKLKENGITPKTIEHLNDSHIKSNLVSEEYCNLCKKMLEMKK